MRDRIIGAETRPLLANEARTHAVKHDGAAIAFEDQISKLEPVRGSREHDLAEIIRFEPDAPDRTA